MDEQTRSASMKLFQIMLMLGGSAAVSFGHADQGAVTTWTDTAMHRAPEAIGAVWLLANTYGWKVSDLFKGSSARFDQVEMRLEVIEEKLAEWAKLSDYKTP